MLQCFDRYYCVTGKLSNKLFNIFCRYLFFRYFITLQYMYVHKCNKQYFTGSWVFLRVLNWGLHCENESSQCLSISRHKMHWQMQTQVYRWRRRIWGIEPLIPSYIFCYDYYLSIPAATRIQSFMIALPAWPWLDRSVQETGWVKNQVSNDSYEH